MKSQLLGVFLVPSLLLCLLLTAQARAAGLNLDPTVDENGNRSGSSFNVKTFGAKGDGVSDDTAAIQNAINAFTKQAEAQSLRVRNWGREDSGVSFHPYGEVVFPPGVYRISRPLVFLRYTSIRGIGEAVIEQSDPTKECLYLHASWIASIRGMEFRGGNVQIRIWNANLGGATAFLSKCRFVGASKLAIECQSYTKGNATPWPPYDLKWKGGMPQLTANPPTELKEWFNSTLLEVSQCNFVDCKAVADVQCDTTVFRDCEILAKDCADGPMFKIPSGKTQLRRVKGSVDSGKGRDPYWIEGGGILAVRECDFDSMSEHGLNVVRVSGVTKPVSISAGGFCIVLDQSRFKSAGSLGNALVLLSEDIPNILSVTHVEESSGRPTNIVGWIETNPGSNASVEAEKSPPAESEYKWVFAENSENLSTSLPDRFSRFIGNSIPDSILKEADVPELEWRIEDLEAENEEILFAAELGLDSNPDTDDTEAIQRIFNLAANNLNTTIIFPGRIIRLSKTIRIPPSVVVKGAGMALFRQDSEQFDGFECPDARQVVFRNCFFDGGRNAISLTTGKDVEARVAFDQCVFMDQFHSGIEFLSGHAASGEINRSELMISASTFATMRGIITNASKTELRSSWAINDPRLNDDAFIANLGGKMRIDSMLANPKLWRQPQEGIKAKVPAYAANWKFGDNLRWIDNYGSLYVLDSRFGGEHRGMCNIRNFSNQGSVSVRGGVTRFYNSTSKNAILFLEKIPRVSVLDAISSVPTQITPTSARVMDQDGHAVDEAGNNVHVSAVAAH